MTDFLQVNTYDVHALLACHPVTCGSFKEYLQATGQALPPAPLRPNSPQAAITGISQIAAQAYCRWVGPAYRLPTMAELQELYREDAADGVSLELWPHTAGHMPELRGGLHTVFLCEWTGEVEELPQPAGRPPRLLGSVFYPPWLRQGSNASHVQAHLSAAEGHSFVTFRLARDE